VQIPKAKKTDGLTDCIFSLLGSERVKAARKILVKSTPGLPRYLRL